MLQQTTKEIIEQEKRSGKRKKIPANFPQLHALLDHMVKADGLRNEKIPMAKKYGTKIMADLDEMEAPGVEQRKAPNGPMMLSRIRNSLAHGNPFDSMPWAGLLELLRDLIEYAYRDWIAREPVERSS